LPKRLALVISALVIGLLSTLAVAETTSAQYYTYPPITQSPSSTPLTTSTPLPTATSSGTNLVLYEGPLTTGATSTTLFGFGNTATDIASPGPTLNLQEGTTYTMTVYNIDPSMAHSWEIVSTKAISDSPLFGAGIDITNFIPSGSSGSVTFTANQTGSFYYVCTRAGHIGFGMWGNVVVSAAVPEMPNCTVAVLSIFVTLTAIFVFLHRGEHFQNKNTPKEAHGRRF
jgi:FtsP/CotA-like multicopper oxidase with cupredoxin domain